MTPKEEILRKLKPCPFCGGEAEKIFIGNSHTKSRRIQIICKGCRVERTDAAIHYDHEWLDKVATGHWNKRTADEIKGGPNEEEKQQMRHMEKVIASGDKLDNESARWAFWKLNLLWGTQ